MIAGDDQNRIVSNGVVHHQKKNKDTCDSLSHYSELG
jgi:hypothetical protein